MIEAQTLEKPQVAPLLIAGVSRCPLLIHYGSDKFIPEKVLPVKNDSCVKPKKDGGLWTSPIDSKWGWKDWNDCEQFRDCDEQNSFTVCLKADAKIFVIKCSLNALPPPFWQHYVSGSAYSVIN